MKVQKLPVVIDEGELALEDAVITVYLEGVVVAEVVLMMLENILLHCL